MGGSRDAGPLETWALGALPPGEAPVPSEREQTAPREPGTWRDPAGTSVEALPPGSSRREAAPATNQQIPPPHI